MCVFIFFFFKQKTAYEMRISDGSSDVCSSDLLEKAARAAKLLHDNNQEDEYAVEVAKLYNSLRATWERGLEDIAFVRVIQRHRDYINAKDLKKVSALNEADYDAFAAGFNKFRSDERPVGKEYVSRWSSGRWPLH